MRLMLFLVLVLLLVNFVVADTTFPVPHLVKMDKGDTAEFVFQVQNIRSTNDVSCGYEVQENPGFEINFEEEETLVSAGKRKNVKLEVRVPVLMEYGNYTARFCVHCKPLIDDFGGATVRRSDCGLPIRVEVGNIDSGPTFVKIKFFWYYIGIIVLAIALIIVYFRRRKHK